MIDETDKNMTNQLDPLWFSFPSNEIGVLSFGRFHFLTIYTEFPFRLENAKKEEEWAQLLNNGNIPIRILEHLYTFAACKALNLLEEAWSSTCPPNRMMYLGSCLANVARKRHPTISNVQILHFNRQSSRQDSQAKFVSDSFHQFA